LDDGLDEVRFSSQIKVVDPIFRASSAGIWINTSICTVIENGDAPDDVVGILPKWPDRVDHDPRLSDSGFHRRVIPNIYDEEPYLMTEFELSLDLF
jgi:hypothetical protein